MEDFDAIIEDRMDTEYKIYVNNLPSELNEGAIRDIFGQYGKIIHMFYPRNAVWAYITYGTYREAEFAIRELNNKKPLCLRVMLAKKPPITFANEQSQNSHVSQDFEEKVLATDVAPPFAYTDIKYRQSIGRGQSINMTRKYSAMSQTTIPHADSELSSQASNIYEPEDHFENTNRLWTRGVVTVTPDGKRHVALGRGYTLYEFPEENPKIEEYIGKVYEKRLKGLYEYGENKFNDRLQKCYTCSIKTTKHCEKCFTYYCSKSCQVKDWPRHQMECERIPALVEETVQNMSTLQVKEEEQEKNLASKPNAVNKTIVSNDNIKLRRPNTPQNAISTHSNGTIFKTEKVDQLVSDVVIKDSSQQNQRFKYNNADQSKGDSTKVNLIRQNYNRNQSNVTNTTNNNKDRVDNNDNVRDKSYTDKNQSFQRHEFQNNRKFSPHNDRQNAQRKNSASSNSNTDDDLAFNKDTYLSNKEFTEIEIVVPLPNNNEYWITKLKDTEARKRLMIQLQNVAAKSRNAKPIIGNIYGVLYEKIWHRAMVISLNPVMVHFIDFGNDEILQKDADIRDIESMPKVPKFAKKIQLTPGTSEKYKNLQYGDKISVRMLSMNTDGTIIVEVQQQPEDLSVRTKESASQSDTSNAMEKTASQEKFKIPPIISIKASKIQIPNVLNAFANLLTEKAVTELKFEGFLDIVESAQMNVYSATLCPNDYSNNITMLLQDMQVECEDMKKSVNCRPQVEDLVCGKGKDGWYRGYVLTSSDLRIITVDEAKILPVDQILPCPKKFLNICAFGVVCKVDHPVKLEVGQVYSFSTIMTQENCKQGSLKIDITVDGEVMTTVIKPWESLITKSIPALAELKSGSEQRSCSAKIVLKDVTRDAPMTRETDQYLRNLTGKEVPLTCVYKGSPSTDGVHLTMPTGESVNDKLNQLLIPNWKQTDDDEHYMLQDMKIANLGRVGDTIMAMVTHTQEVGKQYMLSPVDIDAWKHFEEVMFPMIKEFCEKSEHYIPKMQELCLALYEGMWYRGACLEQQETATTSQIFFLDYGNIDSVKHQDIRRMPIDFTSPPAMANLCTVVNLAPLDNAGNFSPTVQQKIMKLVSNESNMVKIKIVEKIDNGDYKVEFPDVQAKLV